MSKSLKNQTKGLSKASSKSLCVIWFIPIDKEQTEDLFENTKISSKNRTIVLSSCVTYVLETALCLQCIRIYCK